MPAYFKDIMHSNLFNVQLTTLYLAYIWHIFGMCHQQHTEHKGIHRNENANMVIFFLLLIYLFVCFYPWQCRVSIAVHGLSLVAASRGYSSLRCAGFSLSWLLFLQSIGSRRTGFSSCGSWALEHRLSSCGARA